MPLNHVYDTLRCFFF